MTTESWDAILRVDLTAPMWCARAAIPHMRAAGHGSIVNISTRQGERPESGLAAYVAAKAGMNGLTRAIAVEEAKFGIRCNTVSPGYVLNDRRDAELAPDRRDGARRHAPDPARSRGRRRERVRLPREPRSRASSPASTSNSTAAAASPAAGRSADRCIPRACVSAISHLPAVARRRSRRSGARTASPTSGVSVAKLEAFGWDAGTALVVDAVERGLNVVDLIGLGPFHLADPRRWDVQRERLIRSIDTAVAVGAGSIVFTTGPFAPLSWEEAADALEAGARAGARRSTRPRHRRSRSSTRTRCASTSGSCTRCATRSTWRAASTRACAWR